MQESSKKWIEVGYKMFAKDGPDGINVERISKIIGASKSAFYRNFIDREVYFSELVEQHSLICLQYFKDIKLIKQWDPDFINLVIKYKTSVLFQIQLRKNMDKLLFKEAFEKIKKRNDKECLHLWAAYLKIPENNEVALQLLHLFSDALSLRLTCENMTYKLLFNLGDEIRNIIYSLQTLSRINNESRSYTMVI